MSENELLQLIKKIDDIKEEFFKLAQEFQRFSLLDLYKEAYEEIHKPETPLKIKLSLIYDILAFYYQMKSFKVAKYE